MIHNQSKRLLPQTILLRMILIITFFLMLFQSIAQDENTIDALSISLEKAENDSLKVEILNDLSWEFRQMNPDTAIYFAKRAGQISDSIFFIRGKITSMNRLGAVAIYQNKYDQAETIYLKVLEAEIAEEYDYGIGRATYQLSEIYRNKGDFEKAIPLGKKALAIFESIEEIGLAAIVSNSLGNTYTEVGQYTIATQYLMESLTIREQLGNNISIANAYLNLGVLAIKMENYKLAKTYLLKSLKIFELEESAYDQALVLNNLGIVYYKEDKIDSALTTYNQVLRIQEKNGLLNNDPILHINLGNIYFQLNILDSAMLYYKKSEALQIKLGYKDNLLNTYNNIGDVHFAQEDLSEAIKHYNKALEIAITDKNQVSKMDEFNNLYLCYLKLGLLDSALFYNNQFLNLQDSLKQDYNDAIALKETLLERNTQIALLKKDNELSTNKINYQTRRSRFILIGSILGGLLLSLLFFAILRGNRQKQRAKLAEKTQKIEEQRITQLLKNQELKSISNILEVQEKERTRIAQDLHDHLGSMLSAIKMHFSSVKDQIIQLESGTTDQYEKANDLLNDVSDEVRKISHNLVSGVLMKFGLVTALEELVDTIALSNQIEIEFLTHKMDNRLDSKMEIAIYRVIQELISNVLKHSQAKELIIQLIRGKDLLNVIVEDNGIGYDEAQTTEGIGLSNIKSRIEIFQGEVNIDTSLNNGTTVSIDIPLNKE